MGIRIALAGNPNSGKTTLFNALTGSNQYVGNWPGVTVEKKEGKLTSDNTITVVDLPGIYSLSPYSLEEVVARNFLVDERPDVILNIIDGTNLERNLYLTTQLIELGIPIVLAINMMDVVRKNGDYINIDALSNKLGCDIVEISALKGDGTDKAAQKAIVAAQKGKSAPTQFFSGKVEHAIAHIEEATVHGLPKEQQRWYAVKLFERDEKVLDKINVTEDILRHIDEDISEVEKEFDDDSDSIIINERYNNIASLIKGCYKKKNGPGSDISMKIDKVVTSRWLGLPIFAIIMFLVYYIAMVSVGTAATDWMNDGVFGEGWRLFGIGTAQYEEDAEEYTNAMKVLEAYGVNVDTEDETFSNVNAIEEANKIVKENTANSSEKVMVEDEDTLDQVEYTAYYSVIPKDLSDEEKETTVSMTFLEANEYIKNNENAFDEPDASDYGVWVPGIPVLVSNCLEKIGTADWLNGIILDGIVSGVGSVLGFVPQMLVLFFLLSFLETCGYMSRIAFILDRIFRRFGLSGKSFIPMLVGTGCGVPGIMASRTIENEKDRRMTIMTTTFMPCGAKVPFIAMIAGAIFGGSAIVSTGAYFIGMAAIIISGTILKKTKMFAGEAAPFVMELPNYHMPTLNSLLRTTWERGWSFIKKAGTVILVSTMIIWFATYFGVVDGTFRMLDESEIDYSILAKVGGLVSWMFVPLGWGTWQAAVASITGLIAKENIVGTMGVLYSGGDGTVWQNLAGVFNKASGMSFLVFNLLCAPCFAAVGAIKREMNSRKWTWFAVGYQTGFAYVISLLTYQIGSVLMGTMNIVGFIAAIVTMLIVIYLLVRPQKNYAK